MTDPLVPNYKPGVGRLVTDRFDFQKHIEGQEFKHTAPGIDLFPTVVINGNTTTTVQDAIYQLSVALNPPVIQDATTFQKGIIQLTGDISGAATNIRVVALRGYPVNTNVPTTNDVLTWNGSSWGPAPNPNPFTAAGDLSGTNTLQHVINISGNLGTVTMTCSNLSIGNTVSSPTFSQSSTTTGNGQNFSFIAQSTSSSGNNGGNVIITGGQRGSGNTTTNGGVGLQIGTGTPSYMVHAAEPVRVLSVLNQRVLGLVTNTALTSSQMGAQTGDLVVYVANAATNPVNPPVGGTILYASAGKLHVRQTDNTDITVGQLPNPDSYGSVVNGSTFDADGQVLTTRNVVTTAGTSPVDALGFVGGIVFSAFAVPQYTTVHVDVVMVGKKDGAADAVTVKMSAGYVRDSGSAGKLSTVLDGYLIGPPDGDGVTYIEHIKTSFLALAWTPPTIVLSGNNIHVKTGASNASENVTWFTTAKFYIGPSYSNP